MPEEGIPMTIDQITELRKKWSTLNETIVKETFFRVMEENVLLTAKVKALEEACKSK